MCTSTGSTDRPFGTAIKLYGFQKKWIVSLLFEGQEVLCPIYLFNNCC
jgi:hypothetical protein